MSTWTRRRPWLLVGAFSVIVKSSRKFVWSSASFPVSGCVRCQWRPGTDSCPGPDPSSSNIQQFPSCSALREHSGRALLLCMHTVTVAVARRAWSPFLKDNCIYLRCFICIRLTRTLGKVYLCIAIALVHWHMFAILAGEWLDNTPSLLRFSADWRSFSLLLLDISTSDPVSVTAKIGS